MFQDELKNYTCFCDCYGSAAWSEPSGVHEENLVCIAACLFSEVKMAEPTDECGKRFRFLDA